MRRMSLFLVAAFAFASLAVGGATAKSGKGVMCVLHAKLAAKNETSGSTSRAKGHTLIKVRMNGTIEHKTHINNKAHETFVAGHIHQAPAGVAGPVVLPLFASSGTSTRQIKDRGSTPGTGTLPADLCANPSAYYINYHTTAFPAGAIRGQLH
jgi:hypothetical protein